MQRGPSERTKQTLRTGFRFTHEALLARPGARRTEFGCTPVLLTRWLADYKPVRIRIMGDLFAERKVLAVLEMGLFSKFRRDRVRCTRNRRSPRSGGSSRRASGRDETRPSASPGARAMVGILGS